MDLLKIRHFLLILCLFLSSNLKAQDPILKTRVLASLGHGTSFTRPHGYMRGGFPGQVRGAGRVSAGNLGGWLIFFFVGAEIPTKQKSSFAKVWFGGCALVPVFRSGGNMRTYPRYGFRSGGASEMYPRSGFRSGGTSAKTTLLENQPPCLAKPPKLVKKFTPSQVFNSLKLMSNAILQA